MSYTVTCPVCNAEVEVSVSRSRAPDGGRGWEVWVEDTEHDAADEMPRGRCPGSDQLDELAIEAASEPEDPPEPEDWN